MAEEQNRAPGIITLLARLVRTSIGALENRFELLAIEWQEERARLTELLLWLCGLLFLGMMAAVLLTITIILIFPDDLRVYAAGGFSFLYLVGAVWVWFAARSLLKREPFNETVEQGRRDKEWLKSFD